VDAYLRRRRNGGFPHKKSKKLLDKFIIA